MPCLHLRTAALPRSRQGPGPGGRDLRAGKRWALTAHRGVHAGPLRSPPAPLEPGAWHALCPVPRGEEGLGGVGGPGAHLDGVQWMPPMGDLRGSPSRPPPTPAAPRGFLAGPVQGPLRPGLGSVLRTCGPARRGLCSFRATGPGKQQTRVSCRVMSIPREPTESEMGGSEQCKAEAREGDPRAGDAAQPHIRLPAPPPPRDWDLVARTTTWDPPRSPGVHSTARVSSSLPQGQLHWAV